MVYLMLLSGDFKHSDRGVGIVDIIRHVLNGDGRRRRCHIDNTRYAHRRIVAGRRQRVFRRQSGDIRNVLLQPKLSRYRRGCVAARTGGTARSP